MTDTDKLRRLAERCTSGDAWYKEGDLMGRQSFGQFLSQDRALIAAANPEAILALIAENERLRAEKEGLCMHLEAVTQNCFRFLAQRDEAVALLRDAELHCGFTSTAADIVAFLTRIDNKS